MEPALPSEERTLAKRSERSDLPPRPRCPVRGLPACRENKHLTRGRGVRSLFPKSARLEDQAGNAPLTNAFKAYSCRGFQVFSSNGARRRGGYNLTAIAPSWRTTRGQSAGVPKFCAGSARAFGYAPASTGSPASPTAASAARLAFKR